ncbi:MAG: hypothetical protein V7709_14075, partial [Halioglobus sp.]
GHFEGGNVVSEFGADCSFDCTYQLNEGEGLERKFIAQPTVASDFVRWSDSLGDGFSICPRPTELECELVIAPIHPLFEGLSLDVIAQFRTVTGYNVNNIQFSTDSLPSGTFKLIDQGRWSEEYANAIPVNLYYVTARTESSLALSDLVNDVRYFFDLSTGDIKKQLGVAAPVSWGTLAGVSAKPNGWVASQVKYGRSNGTHTGDYIQIDAQFWGDRKRGKSNYKFVYQEVKRDDSSVYLRDETRDVDIQLHLEAGRVYSSKKQAQSKEIGTVQRVLQPGNGLVASEVSFSSESSDASGLFVQTGAKIWVEKAAENGEVLASYELTSRSISEINLVDYENNMIVKINFADEVINKGFIPLIAPSATYQIDSVK